VRAITTNMGCDDRRPYFLWDKNMSINELRAVLAGPTSYDRDRLLGKMLREARDLDVWRFVRPAEVALALDRLRPRIGRRYPFWRFLIDGWRADGLLAG